jgi:tetratricopeptide (TPR) repeat protein
VNDRSQPDASLQRRVAGVVQRLEQALRLHKGGQLDEAVAEYRWILDRFPDHADVNHYLGMAEQQRGDSHRALALIRKAIELEPRNALFHANLGRVLLALEEAGDAAIAFERARKLAPDDAQLVHLHGRALRLAGEAEAALPILQQACELTGQAPRAVVDLACALAACHQHSRAVERFREVLDRDAGHVEALRGLSGSLRALNRSAEAICCLETALGRAPQDPGLWCEHGTALEEAGQFDAAVESFRKALGLRPGFPLAVARLLARKAGLEDTRLVGEAERHLREERVTRPVRVELHFALGRHYDAAADYDAAFGHYEAANDIVSLGRRYRRGGTERRIDNLIRVFDRALFETPAAGSSDSDRPLFIVGMPRSGTTLTEQVLSSHGEIEGAGELGYFMHMAYALAEEADAADGSFDWVAKLTAPVLKRWSDGYLARLDEVSATARRVTDKMPLNFLNLGLIALAFPRARVIHCLRDPLDNCLSCFVENMHQDQRYSTRLASLGHFYVQYRRVMAHWHDVLPLPILDVRYEDLVDDFEAQARRMIDFCGLEWDERCLQYYRTERAVTTPSKWQVRQPIYRSSVSRWRRYERHLGTLREALQPVLDAEARR